MAKKTLRRSVKVTRIDEKDKLAGYRKIDEITIHGTLITTFAEFTKIPVVMIDNDPAQRYSIAPQDIVAALATLTEGSERQLDEASKNKPGMNNQEDIRECVAQLLRLIPVCPPVIASVLHGCFRQISGEGCLVDHKLHRSDEAAEGQLIKTAICRNERRQMVKDIIDHSWIGAKVKYRRGVGTIVAARTGGHMVDLETGEMTDDTVQFKIKPDSDGRAFWTCTYVNSPVPGKAFL